jgi:C1A family cysteine protease
MILLLHATVVSVVRTDLRTDGVPVMLMEPGQLEAEMELHSKDAVVSSPFSAAFVERALKEGVDWRDKGAVTPAKDQGAHGYCGTFGRTCAAEGQYAIHSGHRLRNFSEEELVECIGWDKNQFDYFSKKGFMPMEEYPYPTGKDDYQGNVDPPIPGHPCKYKKLRVIEGTADMSFTNVSSVAHNDEDQLAAWIFKNGPVNSGVDAAVMGLREKGCEKTGDCFITHEMCKKSQSNIDHSITLVGFGTDKKHGDYWLVKNSWSTKFANDGFIKLARGYKDENHTNGCAHIACCGWVPCYGDCPSSA